jgi:hemolysin activation/secretion protein
LQILTVINNKKMHIKNSLLCCTFLALIISTTPVNAAGIAPALTTPDEQFRQRQLESQEHQRQQEILKSLRQQQEIKTDVRDEVDALKQIPLKASIDIPDNETPCFAINKIELVGDDVAKFQFALDEVLSKNIPSANETEAKPILGRCLGVQGINAVMNRVQNAIIAKGYVTTRILVAPQDLKAGLLQLTVIPGHVGAIRFTPDSSKRISMWNAAPINAGDILNLRDIEQTLENLKRVPMVKLSD